MESGGFRAVLRHRRWPRVARLAFDLDDRVFRRKSRENAAMVDLDDVHAGLLKLAAMAASAPGRSCAATAAVPSAPAERDRGQAHRRADACRCCRRKRRCATFFPGKPRRIGQHRGKTRRAGAFHNALLDRDEDRDRAFDVAFGDQDDLVGDVARIRDVSLPGSLTAMPSASVSPPIGRNSHRSRVSSTDRVPPRRRSARCPA